MMVDTGVITVVNKLKAAVIGKGFNWKDLGFELYDLESGIDASGR
jgi:hypothetical protein